MSRSHRTATALLLLAAGCAGRLPTELPPLADMDEPLELLAEPDDETERRRLDPGTFSGVYTEDPRRTLADKLAGAGTGVLVTRIVENSPGAAADIRVDDLLLEAAVGGGEPAVLASPSQWRQIELAGAPGTVVRLVYDRAGVERETALTLEARIAPPPRHDVERLREEERVGVVLRTATEVEARRAGLGPGAGAVVVGLARGSPWRRVGLRFGDLLVEADHRAVAHPQVVIDAVRTSTAEVVDLVVFRGGRRHALAAPLSRRAAEAQQVWVPLIIDHRRERGVTDTSLLLGLFRYRSTVAAWRIRLLWLLHFCGGDADRLLEVDQ